MKYRFLFIILALILFSLGVYIFPLRFNIYSNSLPYGVYRVVQKTPSKGCIATTIFSKEIAQHGIQRGYLLKGEEKTGIMPVAKIIQGEPGDTVLIRDNVLIINGVPHPEYSLLTEDSQGRPIKRFCSDSYTIPCDHYLLLSDYKPNSWDSRYFGPVPVEYVLEPVFLFE